MICSWLAFRPLNSFASQAFACFAPYIIYFTILIIYIISETADNFNKNFANNILFLLKLLNFIAQPFFSQRGRAAVRG